MKTRVMVCLICFGLAPANAFPATPNLVAQGYESFHRGDFTSATLHFQNATRYFELRSDATLGWARSLLALGKAQEAKKVLLEGVERYPADANLRFGLAEVFLSLREGEDARRELERVSLLRPFQAGLKEKLGLAYAQTSNQALAIEKLESALQVGEISEAGGAVLVELLLESNERARAFRALSQIEKKFSASAQIFLMRARAETKYNPLDAEIAYRKALQANPRSFEGWREYGEFLLARKQDLAEAEQVLRSALVVKPGDLETLCLLAKAQRRQGKLEAAIESLKEALAISPGSDLAMVEYILTLQDRGDLSSAALMLQAWVERHPEKKWAADVYAKVLEAVERPGRAEGGKILLIEETAGAARGNEGHQTTYVVQPGDVLGTISAKLFGTTKKWQEIAAANAHQITDPNKLEVGATLRIPARRNGLESAGSVQRQPGRFIASAEPIADLPVLPQPSTISEPNEVYHQYDAPLTEPSANGFRLQAGMGPVVEAAELSGSGFSADLPQKLGVAAEVLVAMPRFWSLLDLSASFQHSRTSFSGYRSISPASIELRKNRFGLRSKIEPFAGSAGEPDNWTSRLGILLGYDWRSKSADTTTPRVLVSKNNLAGPTLGAAFWMPVGSNSLWESSVEFFFPATFREYSASSGEYESAGGASAATSILVPVSERIDLKIGLHWRTESVRFQGAGSRGTVNATEREWAVFLPIAMRVK